MIGASHDGIGVLIVDDSRFVRRLLRGLLEAGPEFRVVGEAGDGEHALRTLRETPADVITLDLDMPGVDGIEFLRRLRRESDVPVVVVTALPAAEAALLFEAHSLQVEGTVEKAVTPDSLDIGEFASQLRAALRHACRIKWESQLADSHVPGEESA